LAPEALFLKDRGGQEEEERLARDFTDTSGAGLLAAVNIHPLYMFSSFQGGTACMPL
jgi:hypothetical protein